MTAGKSLDRWDKSWPQVESIAEKRDRSRTPRWLDCESFRNQGAKQGQKE